MFIDLTRYGGARTRLAVAAIAYLNEIPDGCAIHLIGGETIRINEDPEEVELRCLLARDEMSKGLTVTQDIEVAKELAVIMHMESGCVMNAVEAVEAKAAAASPQARKKRS